LLKHVRALIDLFAALGSRLLPLLTVLGSLLLPPVAMSKGYSKIYLSQPVRIEETIAGMRQSGSITDVQWRKKLDGKHYSPEVPTIWWKGREDHVFKFEVGIQRWEN